MILSLCIRLRRSSGNNLPQELRKALPAHYHKEAAGGGIISAPSIEDDLLDQQRT